MSAVVNSGRSGRSLRNEVCRSLRYARVNVFGVSSHQVSRSAPSRKSMTLCRTLLSPLIRLVVRGTVGGLPGGPPRSHGSDVRGQEVESTRGSSGSGRSPRTSASTSRAGARSHPAPGQVQQQGPSPGPADGSPSHGLGGIVLTWWSPVPAFTPNNAMAVSRGLVRSARATLFSVRRHKPLNGLSTPLRVMGRA